MTRLEKCEILKNMGYTYDPITGKIFGVKGNEIVRKDDKGYICLFKRGFRGSLFGHHFAWYMSYGNVDFDLLDHEDQNPSNNRIDNLRILNNQKNTFNSSAKGYYQDKTTQKWCSQIMLNRKKIHLGCFNNENDAREAYLIAKSKYHII